MTLVKSPSPADLIEVLRKTLAKVERSTELAPDDPSLQDLKRRVLLLIAKLESQKFDAA